MKQQTHKKKIPIQRTFLHDAVDLVALGSHSLERDDFSDCFRPVSPYNMRKSGILYVFSFLIRYFILFPIRLMMLIIGIILFTGFFCHGCYYNNSRTIQQCFLLFNKFTLFVLNFKIVHKGEKKMRNEPHVYVSNHTSFIDYLVLSSHEFSHACISEGHSGLFGFILNQILSRNGSIGFKRSDRQDRSQVLKRIKDHIHEKQAPMLIFPEGTCVNNESIVLFQKGAFELDAIVCPVGIKYRKDLVDPYWNRRLHGFTLHMFYLLTRWGLNGEVHWMKPIRRQENEDVISFSHRIKNRIAKEIGLRNTLWNGYFKSSPVLKDREMLRNSFNKVYSKIRNGLIGSQKIKDLEEGRPYLLDENIDQEEKDNRVYFSKFSYRGFVNECCKEYLRLKAHNATVKNN